MNGITRILNTSLIVAEGNSLTLMDILVTVGLFLLFYLLAGLSTKRFRQWLDRRSRIGTTYRHLLASALNVTILFVGVYASLSYLGIDMSFLLVPLGALSIGLGLGLQSLASNYVAGLVLLNERTIRDGDLIEIDNIQGTVLETGLRTTVVKTFGNTEVILPNSLLVSQRLDNWTKSDHVLRVDAHIGVAYGSDIDAVHALLYARIVQHPAVLAEPEPCTFLVEFADSALLFRIMYWINDPAQRLSSLSEILGNIYHELNRQNIVIPFPQRDVWLRTAQSAPGTPAATTAREEDMDMAVADPR